MLKLETEEDLFMLFQGNVKESLHLEYKDSRSVDKGDDKKKLEMARDISAFANADGGQIIYGMTEKDHEPAGLDEGLDPKVYSEIWFEQVLQQHVTPMLAGVKPRHVPLVNGRVAVVIDVPATNGDPHQVDGRYYRRHNFNRLAMEHYEVRDAFRRLSQPDLVAKLMFNHSRDYEDLHWNKESDDHRPVGITPLISNLSNEPALYAVVNIFVDQRIWVAHDGYEAGGIKAYPDGTVAKAYRARFHPAQKMPIYKEMPTLLPALGLVVKESELYHVIPYKLGWDIRAPGCFKEQNGIVYVDNGGKTMRIRMQ